MHNLPQTDRKRTGLRYQTALRELITEHFGEEDLRTLCFDLGLDYDDLPGRGRPNKIRDLIAHCKHHGRLSELERACANARPSLSWSELLAQRQAAHHEKNPDGFEYSPPVKQGLEALLEFFVLEDVQSAIAASQIEIEAAREQSKTLADYKLLHDQLHVLQFHCFVPVTYAVRRFPDDEYAIVEVTDYGITLEGVIRNLRAIASAASFSTFEMTWVNRLETAHSLMTQALDTLEVKPLHQALRQMNRVLADQPSRINDHLRATAQSLRLQALLNAMQQVSEGLDRFDGDPERVRQFEAGVDALSNLNDDLSYLVDRHDKWQAVDRELRRVDANLDLDTAVIC
jgi:hypothetical protein